MAFKKVKESNKWSKSSTWEPTGVPKAEDDVEIQAGKEVKIEAEAECRSLLVAGVVTGTFAVKVGNSEKPTEGAGATGYAFKVLSTATVTSWTGAVKLISTYTGEEQKVAGEQALKNAALETTTATTAKYKQVGELNVSKLSLTGGVWDTAGNTLKLNSLLVKEGKPTVKLGASEVKIAVDCEFKAAEGTLEAGTSVVKLTTAKGEFVGGAGNQWNKVIVEAAEAKLNVGGGGVEGATDTCKIAELEFLTKGKAATVMEREKTGLPLFEVFEITTANGLKGNGTATEFVKLVSSESGKPWRLKSSSGQTVKYFELKDSHASGATFTDEYEGSVSEGELNISGNEGWTFTKAGGGSTGKLEGAATLKFASAPSLKGNGALQGPAAFKWAGADALTGKARISGTAAMRFAGTDALAGKGGLSGTSATSFAGSQAMAGKGSLAGPTATRFTATGRLNAGALGQLAGVAAFRFSGSRTVSGVASLAATTQTSFALVGALFPAESAFGVARVRIVNRKQTEVEMANRKQTSVTIVNRP